MRRHRRNFLFARKSPLDGRTVAVSVECYDKDHAIARLKEHYPHVNSADWDLLEELEPQHFCGGGIGEHLPMEPTIAQLVKRIYH